MATALLPDVAAQRPLALRMRGDLAFCQQQFAGRRYWAVKDPVALEYFHLSEEEYRLLTMLDGRTSLEEIRSRISQLFAPRRLSAQQVQSYLSTLHRHGLVLSDAPGQAAALAERRAEKRQREWFERLLGVLAIRFRGINPRPLVDWLTPKCGWVFSPLVAGFVLAMVVTAIALVAVEFDTFLARLPEFGAIVGASNLPWLLLVLAGTKIAHELGHAVACRRFGGDCHELGLMLLVFTPCLYCNVSDAWMIRDKWRRIAIAAAGMYVELILATAAAFLWWFSAPGLFNSLCLNLIIVCSVGTLLFNGNPLLRYDGYYILSDLVEVPNLKAQSSAVLRGWLARLCLGIDLGGEAIKQSGPRQALLAAYALASTVYRLVVVGLVYLALLAIVRPYHLEVLLVPLVATTVLGLLWPGLQSTIDWARDPGQRRRYAPARVAMTCLLLAAALAAAFGLPLPRRVSAPAMLDYRDAARVYVTESGVLESAAHVGEPVKSGGVLARLKNPAVALEIARLTSDRDQQRLFVTNLESRRLQGDLDSAQIPAARAALADAENRLAQVERDAQKLTIIAPQAGTVLPPPARDDEPQDETRLHHWSGTPLDERNLGATLDSGTLLCLVGDPRKFEAIVHVDENDVEQVQIGARVRVAPDDQPGTVYEGTISEVARLDLDVMPRELAVAGDLPARTDEQGLSRPLQTWYQARVEFDHETPLQTARVHGRAKIDVAGETVATRVGRFLRQTFGR